MLYTYIVTGIVLLIFLIIPKTLQKRDVYVIWITIVCIELVADLFLWNIMGLYYFAGDERFSFGIMGIKLLASPSVGLLFLNYMPNRFSNFILYWLLWAIFSTFFEWTTVYFGYLTYTGWTLWYSFIFYALILLLLRWHYFYIKQD
ncbi:hypothetical protein BTR23_14245 [Alkalihalophilus pseudofirmus]|nr:hypothetical protein BTR23_14245 [Alkalihalophilus pseudofirmus]